MKISYICHACIYVETSDAKIVCDPWWDGPAYQNQWHVFPRPVNEEVTAQANFVLISHGHEDHLHAPTLHHIDKWAHVFFPYQWKDGANQYLHDLGFVKVTEAISFTSYQITPETKITYIANNLDAMIVIENKGKVLVNLNDALNAHHKSVMRMFMDEIKKRWPHIDYLICGLGGAGYFPNTVHYANKDDKEVGLLREQFLAHNFCKLINGLQPKRVIPFLPGFALLADDKRWINGIKFPREKLQGYFTEYFDPTSSIEWMNLFPGDWIENGAHKKSSVYHQLLQDGDLSYLVEEIYADEIKSFNTTTAIPEKAAVDLLKKMIENIPHAARAFHHEALDNLFFSLKILNATGKNILNVSFENPDWHFEISDQLDPRSHLLVRTQSQILEYSLATPWGGDVMMVGYGADIDVHDEIALKENHDIVCLRLLTRIPLASDYALRQPARMLKFMLTNPVNTSLSIKQKLLASGNPNKIPYNERSHWINKTPCDICRACNMPLLTYEFGEQLEQSEFEIVTQW